MRKMPVTRGFALAVACQGKDQLSAGQARELADRMRRRDRNSRISAYRCDGCGQWHVGSTPAMLRGYRNLKGGRQ